jgi:hypothetical protein
MGCAARSLQVSRNVFDLQAPAHGTFLGLITEHRIRRGVFKSVAELQAAIEQYLETHNADPRELSRMMQVPTDPFQKERRP